MPTPNVPQIQQANSTSYVDTVGLQIGLDRLQGETTLNYLKRLEAATKLQRNHPYEGAFNEMNLQLGFQPQVYINLPSVTGILSVSIAGVVIGSHAPIPLLTFDNDSMWRWRMLSSVVSDINVITPATLLATDGPAFQLARQTNSLWSFAENISGTKIQLSQNSGIQVGSEMFNINPPAYTLTTTGILTFSTEVPAGTQITYNYIVTPYDVVGAPVAMIGFTDPEFASVAATSNNALAYQVREFIQSIMRTDRSYWAK